jgi:hypothetical protein
MGYGSGMSNSLNRFKVKLEKTPYFVATLTGPPKEIDTLRVVLDSFPVKVEVPIVWKWKMPGWKSKAPGLPSSVSFDEYCPRCQRLDTGEVVFVHFNFMEPMNAMEVLAWASKE